MEDSKSKKAYLVGAGIASLASATYLIRDGKISGKNIHILEESDQTGGSMDAHGSPEKGYTMRGGRMFDEEAYTCTYDLLSFIPRWKNSLKSVKEKMFEFNDRIRSHSHCRLVENGEKVDVSSMGFSMRDRLDLVVGDPMDTATELGPMSSEEAAVQCLAWVGQCSRNI